MDTCVMNLTEEEASELERILDQESRRLLVDIHRTDHHKYREKLERQLEIQERIRKMLRRVEVAK